MFGVGCFWLKTTIIIKIESHSFYPIICAWFRLGWSPFFFFLKKKSKRLTQKNWDFQNRQFSIFFTKISGIGHWIYRINWCKRHGYGSFGQPDNYMGWAISVPFTWIYPINPRTNPWNFGEKILRIGGFENVNFF